MIIGVLPAPIARVLAASSLDGAPMSFGANGLAWIQDPRNDARRRACLLNVLAMLCVKPSPAQPFIDDVLRVAWVREERIYCVVRGSLLNRLRLLSEPSIDDAHAHRYVFAEGHPVAPVHGELAQAIYLLEGADLNAADFLSFRCDGNPSLQIVLPSTPAVETYADIDLDRFNPLADVVDLIGHAGELLDAGPTDHLALRPAVAQVAGNFLAWDQVA